MADVLKVTVLVLYLVSGIPLNIIVIAIVKRKFSMQNTTNILVCNIAAADMVSLLYQFAMFIENIPGGMLGRMLCKLLRDDLFWAVSALTLSLVSVERYLALLKPMISNVRLTRENVKYAISLLWISSSLIILLPQVFILDLHYDANLQKHRCFGNQHSLDIYNGVINGVFAIAVAVV